MDNNINSDYSKWEKGKDYPEFMDDIALATISKGYLQKDETPKQAFKRVAHTAAYRLRRPDLENKFFKYIWKGWLCLASPVLSNTGTEKGLPISCFGLDTPDSVTGIGLTNLEMMKLTSSGGGVGISVSRIRPRGAKISNGNGISEGVVPWCKIYDSTIIATNQGQVRRGAASVNLKVSHPDIKEFLRIRRPQGDVNRQCLNLHQCVVIDDAFMKKVEAGDKESRDLWIEILKTRIETGEPYIMFEDNVNNANPLAYKKNNLLVSMTNICCVTGDTPILTSKGYLPIEHALNQQVSVWDGTEFISTTVEYTGKKKILKVGLSDGTVLYVSDNHKFAILKDKYKDSKKGKYFLEEIKAIPVGTSLAKFGMPVIKDGLDYSIDAYSQGFYSGDGNANLEFSWLYQPKYACETRLIGEISKENPKTQRKTWKHGPLLDKNFVPINGSVEYRLNWLAGLFDSDGCEAGNSIQLVSTNQRFLNDVKLMLTTLGVTSKVRLRREAGVYDMPDGRGGKKAYQCQECFIILIPSKDLRQLIKLGLKTNRIDLSLVEETQRESVHFVTITSIEDTETEQDTYCFNNPVRGLGTFNGVVTGQSEISLFTDEDHSFICCLSSLNLTKYDEWKDSDLVETAVYFLDGILEEFLYKTDGKRSFERAHRSALKGRALGLGVLGWHTFLQQKNLPFACVASTSYTNTIFSQIKNQAEYASRKLADEYGEPEWCRGTGMRNSHLIAIAPTVSNSTISGGVSAGVEPLPANCFLFNSAKGSFLRKNKELEKYLEKRGHNTEEVWDQINKDRGSVMNLPDEIIPQHDKEVFLTFAEINQMSIVEQAIIRQKYVDQAVSLNLKFDPSDSPKFINSVHLAAWKGGIKTLYYLRSESVLRADIASRTSEECQGCSG